MNRFLHSRYSVLLAVIVAAGCAFFLHTLGAVPQPSSCMGLIPRWSAPWPIPSSVGMWMALGVNALLAVLLATLVKTHNVLRSMTMLPGAMYLYMQLATPAALASFYPGILLALVAILGIMLLYANYAQAADCQRSVFLAMLMPSVCISFDVSFAILIPIFGLGCAQMKLINMRTVLAMLMGIATPWIIILGLGIASPADIDMPGWAQFFSTRGNAAQPGLIGAVAATVFIGIGAWMQNVMKYLTYNAQSRSMLSLLTVALLAMMVAVVAGFRHAYAYIPLLNCMVAMQIGHLFGVIYNQKKAYLAIITIAAIYMGFYLWIAATLL